MEDERIETRWFTGKEIEQGIRSGKIVDGKTMIGYFNWKCGAKA
jgi:ADP-ribose pyrophosphatase